MNKYAAIKQVYNGQVYDSKGEARLALEIDLLLKAKEITKVERQVKFPLFGVNENLICNHVVDFLLTYPDGRQEAWEFKGFATDVWKIKRKLFEDNYPKIKYVVVTSKDPRVFIKRI